MRPATRPARWTAALGLAAALSLGASGAGAQNVRVLPRTPDPRTDSLVDRIYKGNVEEVQRLVAEWREREGQLVATLRSLPPEGDVPARRRLDEDLMRSSREAFAMMRAIEDRCEMERGPVPRGYVGVSLDTRIDVVDGRPIPSGVMVSSVEPGGPSQRAGVQRNDRLIAIDGRDARQRIPEIADLLVPGRSLVLRVERGGVERDISIVVEPRPKGFAESCGEFERALMPLRLGMFTGEMRLRRSGPPGAAGGVRVETGPVIERQPRDAPDEIRVFVFSAGDRSEVHFGGAKFRTLDGDWSELLGVKQGVMVYDVAVGSVAARAGLKGGDVVTTVGRDVASDPMVFLKLLEVESRQTATLSVVRDKKERTVTLRWGSQP